MAIGVETRITCGALAIMTIILSMGENTMAQTKSTTVVRNIVLVHGGFVDGSGWEGVYNVLKNDGYTVTVVQNPTISLVFARLFFVRLYGSHRPHTFGFAPIRVPA
jgi:hypothetical protein